MADAFGDLVEETVERINEIENAVFEQAKSG